MARTRFVPNIAGFAALRNDPKLVSAMETSANTATIGTSFDVRVEVWPHRGRKTGPRTSVQIWAESFRSRAIVNRDPAALTSVLDRARF